MNKNIDTVKILNVNIAAINMNELMTFTIDNIKNLKGHYMCVANVHTTVLAYEDKNFCDIENGSILTIPDGGPLAYLGRRKGYSNMARTTGPDYMKRIFEVSSRYNYKHFFYGSSQETLDKLKANILKDYPGISIVGTYAPPFRELTKDEDVHIIETINNTKPDFIWVGLGAYKQETWMYKHNNLINGFMVGVGAGFDYYAGNIKRAPMWMQRCCLEWFYRLIQEPKRLFKRYLITNTKFLINAVIRGK